MHLPIILSTHAEERLIQRMRVKPEKFYRTVRKAWLNEASSRRGPGGVMMRDFSGHVFVFDDFNFHDRIILVTIYNPREENNLGRWVRGWERFNV